MEMCGNKFENLVMTGLDWSLVPGQCQSITWTKVDLL